MRFVCVIYLRVVCFCTSVVTSFQFLCTAAVENYLYAHNLVFHWSHSWKNFWILNYCLLLFEGFDPPRKGLRSLFTRLNERRYDIIFLQETYSIVDVEDIWRTQWRGKLFFAHGSNHSCGVMIPVTRSDLDFNSGQELVWWRGLFHYNWSWGPRFAIFVCNSYAPNKVQNQRRFFLISWTKILKTASLVKSLELFSGENLMSQSTLILTEWIKK